MVSEPGVGAPKSATFAQALDALKREGSNVLLVGDDTPSSHESACHRLLGDANRDARYRLCILTDRSRCCSVSPVHRPDGDVERNADELNHIILQTAADAEETDLGFPVDSTTETHLLGVLGVEAVETINEFEEAAGGFDPSQLRLCIDSLAALLEEHETENVFRLLHVLTTRVRQGNGMGHYHLPVDRDHDAVRLFEPLFDAVVEIREDADGCEHRWHLRDKQTSSDWVEL